MWFGFEFVMGAALALLVLSVVVMIIVGVVGHKDTDHRHDAEQRSRPKYRQPKTEHEIYKESILPRYRKD